MSTITNKEALTTISDTIFSIKEKIPSDSFLTINNMLKVLFDNNNKNDELKTKLFKDNLRLSKDFINITRCFSHMYVEYNQVDECIHENLIQSINVESQ